MTRPACRQPIATEITEVARTGPPTPVSLWVAVESFTADRGGAEAIYVFPGAILRGSNPVVRAHSQYFRPLVLIAEVEPDLELTDLPVQVIGLADADAAFSWLQLKVAGTVRSAETSLYNVGADT